MRKSLLLVLPALLLAAPAPSSAQIALPSCERPATLTAPFAFVTVNGQCTNVTIDTTLADDDTADGKEICEAAGKVVYTGDINSVTVRTARAPSTTQGRSMNRPTPSIAASGWLMIAAEPSTPSVPPARHRRVTTPSTAGAASAATGRVS